MNWENLKRAILVAAEKAEIETKIKKRNGKDKGWFDEECKNQQKKVWNRLKAYLEKKTEEMEQRAQRQRPLEREGRKQRGKNWSWRNRERK